MRTDELLDTLQKYTEHKRQLLNELSHPTKKNNFYVKQEINKLLKLANDRIREIKKEIQNIDYNFAIKNLNSHKFKSEESEIPFSRLVESKIDLKASLKNLLSELNKGQSSPQKIDDAGLHEFGVELEGIIKKRQKQLNMV
jgi:aspartyl/asparaginyl-tRNA synthetase